ncbi:uncharacterized protein LOC130739170 [Lotus japonicus]|uniref:uncharacterized protein LOC130739170 n=1 Tax=Lotus japonicus TaxID=34305 RepID=UPI002587F4D4|nr:uncharacterized protein LOC130739170 [Lotus japonicus]
MESEDDQWELCNDDGFVYKRKRRRLHPPPPPPEADQEAEKRRKERKRQTLLKLKAKYEKEILQWESLSNTLRSMQISAHQLQPPLQNQTPLSLPSSSSSSLTDSALLQDLLSQVEAQEAVIQDISSLCDVAEAMCSKREEQFKQSLFDLPIWASPLDLMQVLCDEYD